jgi:hypothetical protein
MADTGEREVGNFVAVLCALFLAATMASGWAHDYAAGSSGICPFGIALADGCSGAQANGTIVDAHLADPQAVVALNIIGGAGYTDGTFPWMSNGGGCSSKASGQITVARGVIGNSNYTITNRGSGCTSRPTIFIPAGASGGSGGSIIPTVYQLTPHNSSPTYNLPGIDYNVGYDTTLTSADPTTGELPSGCTFSGHTVTCGGSGGILNGWNFGTHSTRLVIGASGWTVSNSLFVCTHGTTTDNDQIHINSNVTSATITYNAFNGGSTLGTGCVTGGMTASIQTVQTSGTLVLTYNYCFLPDSKCFNVGSLGSGTTLVIIEKYNFWGELGTCGGGCAHGEAEYSYGSASQTLNWTLQFNVGINHFHNGPTNLTSELAQEGDSMIVVTDTEYNYILAQGNQSYRGSRNARGQVASAPFYCGHQEGGSESGTFANNFLDYSGAFFPFNTTSGTCSSDLTFTNNHNAGTGKSCNPSVCN